MHVTPTSPRLTFRPCDHADVERLHRHWNDPAVRLHLWDDRPVALDTVREVVAASGTSFVEHAYGIWLLADERGFVPVDARMATNVPHVFAIGDVARGPLLAHKAMHEGKAAAEAAFDAKAAFDARAIPAVAYTDPEVAWVGLIEADAKSAGREIGVARFPWSASGRALGMGRSEGLTKLIYAKDTKRILGAGIVGPHAGDLIAECTLAIELGADVDDVALTIHPHPTLSESIGIAAEVAAGTATDLAPAKRAR